MSDKKIIISEEQLDALAQSLLPAMQEFFLRRGVRSFGKNILKRLRRVIKTMISIVHVNKSSKST